MAATAVPKVKKAAKIAEHPKNIDMISQAIGALKERTGSSRIAILKYIIANFNGLGAESSINAHLKMTLKAGVTKGTLKQSKGTGASGSFKLGEKPKAAKKPKVAKKPVKAKKPATKKPVKKVKTPKKAAKKPAKTAASKSPKKVKKAKTPKKEAKKPAAKKTAAKKAAAKKPAGKKIAAKKSAAKKPAKK